MKKTKFVQKIQQENKKAAEKILRKLYLAAYDVGTQDTLARTDKGRVTKHVATAKGKSSGREKAQAKNVTKRKP